jgi:hypothetical protein
MLASTAHWYKEQLLAGFIGDFLHASERARKRA